MTYFWQNPMFGQQELAFPSRIELAVALIGPRGMLVGIRKFYSESIAKRPLNASEERELAAVYATMPQPYEVSGRPFRAPHHTVSEKGLAGSLRKAGFVPGEVQLSSFGMLVLDELGEFRRSAIEATRYAMRAEPGGVAARPEYIVGTLYRGDSASLERRARDFAQQLGLQVVEVS